MTRHLRVIDVRPTSYYKTIEFHLTIRRKSHVLEVRGLVHHSKIH